MSLLQRTFGDSAPGNSSLRKTAKRLHLSNAHRIRVGLTGLGAIFLFVMISAASLQPSAAVSLPEPPESLAVLGVAPGASPSAAAQEVAAAVPAPVRRPTRS
jgi:hypothetical protein